MYKTNFDHLFNEHIIHYLNELLLKQDSLYTERFNLLYKTNYSTSLIIESGGNLTGYITNPQEIKHICLVDIDKNYRSKVRAFLSSIPITESFDKLRFSAIFSTNATEKKRMNASQDNTKDCLYNAIKYQIIGSHYLIKHMDEHHKKLVMVFYAMYLTTFINNSMTWNSDDNTMFVYRPIFLGTIKLMINTLYNELYIEHNYNVYTINGSKWELDINYIKRTSPLTVKRFSETQLKDTISKAEEYLNHKPSVNELVEYINNSINPEDYDYDMDAVGNMMVNYRKVKHYIDMYELSDMISKVVRRSKEQIAEDKANGNITNTLKINNQKDMKGLSLGELNTTGMSLFNI